MGLTGCLKPAGGTHNKDRETRTYNEYEQHAQRPWPATQLVQPDNERAGQQQQAQQ